MDNFYPYIVLWTRELFLFYEMRNSLSGGSMISIDLDDGVKHNYAIFQDVLAKIK